MPRYEVSARVRSALAPEQLWPVLAVSGGEVAGAPVTCTAVEERPPVMRSYRIVGGLPVRDHLAVVELVVDERGTDVVWRHWFRARIPGTGGWLRTRLERQAAEDAAAVAAGGGP